MVDEREVRRLHGALRDALRPERAARVAHEAGRLTGDDLLAQRIPGPAQAVLRRPPARYGGDARGQPAVPGGARRRADLPLPRGHLRATVARAGLAPHPGGRDRLLRLRRAGLPVRAAARPLSGRRPLATDRRIAPARRATAPARFRARARLRHNGGMTPPSSEALEQARQAEQWQRNKPSIFVDLGLALFFFVSAKLTDLTTAALLTAAAGLAVFVAQRFVEVDLLGGLAIFGVVMLLVSAGFSLVFQDEDIVKMKGTWLGLLTAALFLGDGLLRQGRYFGRRLARYVMQPIDERRLAIGLGLLGATMALLNWGVARVFSTDVWLAYTTFGDIVVSMVLFFAVLRFARVAPGAAAGSGAGDRVV